ncbi:MAG: ribonuclease HI [Rhizobacter sp.]|nr:ribonuclease HI [Chlorobiales bacterium]
MPVKAAEKNVLIYTDGACSGNPGEGGWGAILIYTGEGGAEKRKEISGYEPQTTNNRMEMTAPIKALELLSEPCVVRLCSDSAYLINAFNEGWLKNWKYNNWKTAAKKPVENKDLWLRLDKLSQTHRITFQKVKGHSTDELNNRADALATGAIAAHRNKTAL